MKHIKMNIYFKMNAIYNEVKKEFGSSGKILTNFFEIKN